MHNYGYMIWICFEWKCLIYVMPICYALCVQMLCIVTWHAKLYTMKPATIYQIFNAIHQILHTVTGECAASLLYPRYSLRLHSLQASRWVSSTYHTVASEEVAAFLRLVGFVLGCWGREFGSLWLGLTSGVVFYIYIFSPFSALTWLHTQSVKNLPCPSNKILV